MHRWPASRPYVVALVIVAIASLIRIVLLTNAERGYGLFVYAIATYLAGRFGGFRSALATLILGAVITLGLRAYYQPTNDGGLNASLLRIGLYFVLGGVIAAQSRREERSRTALEQERARLEHLEERIRESQQKLLLAIQAGQLGTWEIRLDRFEVEMSDIAGAMHGYPPDTRVMPLEEIFGRMHPDDSVRARVMLEGRLRGDEKTSLTYRIVLPDGQQRMIEAVGDLYTDENNIPVRLLGVCSDVTEQRQAEHALRKAEERFRLLAMHAPVGIAQSDAEGRNFFANPKWCEVSGGTPEELRGYGWERFIHPDDKQRAIEGWQKAMASCETYTMEQCRFLHPDGEVRWAICTTVMLCDDEGKVTGQIGCALDVTEHMAAEEAVRASEAQLKAILANTTSLIFLKDLRGRYLLANPRWHDVLHKKPEEVIGKTDYEVFPREFADVFVGSDETVKQSGVPHTFEEDAPQDDGIHTYLSVKFPIRDDHGVMTATGGIATDITDLKQANAALEGERNLLRNYIDVQENEKQFICYEIHDGIIQYTAGALMLLESYRRQQSDAEGAASLDSIIDNLRIAVDEGRRVIQGVRPTVLDDGGVVPAIDDLVARSSDGLEVEFVHNDVGRLPKALETALYRVTQEALTNARLHSGSRHACVKLQQNGDDIHLEIEDHGKGFDVRAPRGKSFGLLGITERVRLLGGQSAIHSKLGEGTRIVVHLKASAVESEDE